MSSSGKSKPKSLTVVSEQGERLGPFFLGKRPGRQHWHICWFDEKSRQTRRKTTGTEDYTAATKLLAEHYLLAEKLEQESPAEVPLMSILRRYYEEHARHLPSAPQVQYSLKALASHIESMSIDDFRVPAQHRIFKALVAEGKSKSYVSRIFSVAKAALRRAYARDEVERIPAFMPLPKAGSRERVLTFREAVALFAAVRSESMARYLVLAFSTGARPGALLELQVDQLDIGSRLIHLNPKGREQNKKRRPTLPMPDVMAEMHWPMQSGSVINHGGRSYSRTGWRSTFRMVARRAGLSGVSPYTIRHTVCTELHRRGVPPAEVAALMGHSAVSAFGTTGNYIHFQPTYLKSAVTTIDNYLREILREAAKSVQSSMEGVPKCSFVPQRAGSVPAITHMQTEMGATI
jgi:integrase